MLASWERTRGGSLWSFWVPKPPDFSDFRDPKSGGSVPGRKSFVYNQLPYLKSPYSILKSPTKDMNDAERLNAS